MSTLEKTMSVLPRLTAAQIGQVYSYVMYLYSTSDTKEAKPDKVAIARSLIGCIPSDMTLEQAREERLSRI